MCKLASGEDSGGKSQESQGWGGFLWMGLQPSDTKGGAAGGEDRGAWVRKGLGSVAVGWKQGEVQEGSEEEEKQIQ